MLFRHYDPGDHVSQEPNSRHDGRDQPYQTDDSHVDVEILGTPGAYARDLSANARPHQALAGRDRPDAGSAVGTDIGVILDGLATVVAVHRSASFV